MAKSINLWVTIGAAAAAGAAVYMVTRPKPQPKAEPRQIKQAGPETEPLTAEQLAQQKKVEQSFAPAKKTGPMTRAEYEAYEHKSDSTPTWTAANQATEDRKQAAHDKWLKDHPLHPLTGDPTVDNAGVGWINIGRMSRRGLR